VPSAVSVARRIAPTHRNGYRSRRWGGAPGPASLSCRSPSCGVAAAFPSFLEPRKRSEQALLLVVQQAYVLGVWTRRVDQLVERYRDSPGSGSRPARILASGTRCAGFKAASARPAYRLSRGGDRQGCPAPSRGVGGSIPWLPGLQCLGAPNFTVRSRAGRKRKTQATLTIKERKAPTMYNYSPDYCREYYPSYHLFYAESTTFSYSHQEVYDLQVG